MSQTIKESSAPTGHAKITAIAVLNRPKSKNTIPKTITIGSKGTINKLTGKPTKETALKV